MTQVAVARRDAAFLAAHLTRLLGWDPQGDARVVVRPGALGVYAAPPLGVLTFVAVPTAADTESRDAGETDTVVAISDLRAAVAAAAEADADPAAIVLPPAVVGSGNLADLPPTDGWQLPIHAVAGDLVPLVDEAVAEFRSRSQQTPQMGDVIAAEVWDRTAWAGLPMRVLHAARLLGLLAQDGSRVAASTAGPWKRFTCVRGQVFVRADERRSHLRLVPAP